jgi:hypothetical protein
MSTSTEPAALVRTSGPGPSIKVVSHTGLFYWWPVWLVGFVLAFLTYLDGGRLAVVPGGTKVTGVGEKVYVLTVPDGPGASLVQAKEATARGQDAFPVRVSGDRNYGMVYVVVALLVVFGSNAPLRGLWSLVALLSLVVVAMLLAYFDLWGGILDYLWGMHIQISLAGYLVPSVALLALWLGTVFGLDQLRYIHFTAGQFTVHKEVGDAREVYDTAQVTVQKRRSDLIRHWLLGLGSGDLVLSLPNQGKEIVLPNVLFVGWKVQRIADLMKTRPVTAN